MNTDFFSKEYQTARNIFLDVLGPPNMDKEILYGFVPGIDDKFLCQKVKSLTLDPSLSICVVGGFAVGKKSLINALIRQERLMTSILPEYGNLIKSIQYGEEDIVILHSDKYSLLNENLTMSYEEYHKICGREDIEDLCQKYRYADFYTNSDFLKENHLVIHDVLTFYDEDMSRFADEVMLRSNILVYCMNAANPFSYNDIEFLKHKIFQKDILNSFFVINGIDRLDFSDDISYSEYVEYIKAKIKELFGDHNKSVDEWFDTRVFFTSAYQALMSRTNRPNKIMEQPVCIDNSVIGVSKLEKALLDYKKDYLKRIDKVIPLKDSIDLHIANLAKIYHASFQRVDEYLIKLENECTESNNYELFYQTRKHYLMRFLKQKRCIHILGDMLPL